MTSIIELDFVHDNCPDSWRNFSDQFTGIHKDNWNNSIVSTLKNEYNAEITLQGEEESKVVLLFADDDDRVRFLLEWA